MCVDYGAMGLGRDAQCPEHPATPSEGRSADVSGDASGFAMWRLPWS